MLLSFDFDKRNGGVQSSSEALDHVDDPSASSTASYSTPRDVLGTKTVKGSSQSLEAMRNRD